MTEQPQSLPAGQNHNGHVPADRLEFKFLVNATVRDRMLPEIGSRLLGDPHGDADAAYSVATIYYDSADYDVYWERARRVTPRHKLRLRRYGDGPETSNTFVEIKTRLRRRVVKRRLALDMEKGLALCAGTLASEDFPPTDRHIAADVLGLVSLRDLRPSCLVSYRRQAFVGPDNLRLTFDARLAYRTANPTDLRDATVDGLLLAPDELVMEIKVHDAVPYWLSALVAREGGVLRRFSKYCRAVEVAGLLDQTPAAVVTRD